MKRIIGTFLVLGLIIGGVYTINTNNHEEVHVAGGSDPGGGGH